MSFKKALLTLSLVAASTFATAIPITGQIGFAGELKDNGTTLKFTKSTTFATTGTYTGLNGISVTTSDIIYVPFYSVANPLWTFSSGANTYSFELLSLIDQSVGPFTLLSGTGTLSATGFDDTAGTWTFSSQDAVKKLTFSAQSAPVVSSVSEPASIALLGLGLAGLGFARRRQAKAA